MQLTLLAFAQMQDALGFRERTLECAPDDTPREILGRLAPLLDPAATRVAIDCEYHDWDAPIGTASEMALIPPVSGG